MAYLGQEELPQVVGRQTGRSRGQGTRNRRPRNAKINDDVPKDQPKQRQRSGRGRGHGHGGFVRRVPQKSARNHSDDETEVGSHRGNSQPKKKGPPAHCLTVKQLEELATGDVDDLITLVNQNEIGFMRAFQHKWFLERKLMLKQLVKILYNLVESGEEETASRVVGQIFVPLGEYTLFLQSVQQLLHGIPLERKQYIVMEDIQAFSHFLTIGKFCIEKIPNHAVQTFPIPLLKDYLRKAMLHSMQKSALEEIEEELQELEECFDRYEMEQLQPKLTPLRRTRQMIDAERDPPEPFTDLSILPVAEELSCEARAFLRPNIVEGGYHDWSHYVDIQFRLLREDFVRPLRRGINDHLQGAPLGGDVRVYTKVKLEQPVSLGSGMGFDVSFDCQPFERLNWNYTKRLINGSLLCLSADKFATIAFATVAERKVEFLEQGLVTVKFEGSVSGFQLNPDCEYTMVESVAYFEAYRHVLARLQEVVVKHEIDTMPFKHYVVDCRFLEMPLPLYTRFVRARQAMFNLQGVIKFKGRSRFLKTSVDLSDLNSWPGADVTDLDESQMEALKTALTQDLSVIQGPPGTGKTFIGLKIVQGLLANRDVWDPHKKSPILVVCYTNHALDQFLEGIQQNPVHGKRPNLTRIGGRCKTDSLADCTLFEKVNRAKEARSIPSHLFKDFAAARREMMEIKNIIEGLMNEMQSSKVALLGEDVLQRYVSRKHYQQLTMFYGHVRPIEVWLGLRARTDLLSRQRSPSPRVQFEQDIDDEEEDSEDEVQVILSNRIVERGERAYRPHLREAPSPFDMTELQEEIDPEGWKTVQMNKTKRHKEIRKQLSKGLEPLRQEDVNDIQRLQPQEKWRLYVYWRDQHTGDLLQELQELSTRYKIACKEFQEKKQARDEFVVEGSDVIGMTTTGAAKYNHIIKVIKPKIVVVEEAAEIFEPHIFTSISPSVQQLILIGDHKQLRPKPTCYELGKRYNFNVSLFERLERNGCPVKSLSIQHRMRPEIASLITPTVYKTLFNASSVETYPHIKGVGKDLYFIRHNFAEKSDADRKSHSNSHEAFFLTALCEYLIKQGYDQSEITLLTLYSGQVLEIKKLLKQRKITRVRTVVVDDFQGEENKIILLSLVRSNREKKIGFVENENRVCVALSRAKEGMFIMGNAEMLVHRKDTIWPQVLKELTSQGSCGTSLPLQCQIHRDQTIHAKSVEDFAKCPNGGCQKLCHVRLECGHACKQVCHPTDREHKNYKCKEKAKRELPGCHHTELVSCSTDIKKVKCTHPCIKILPCGHPCAERCSSPCTIKCTQPVRKTLACGHTVNASCYLKAEEVICSEPCNTLLECEHQCTGTCGTCERGRLHVQCTARCGRTLVCEHICKFPCTTTCPPCTEPCNNFCVHSKCPKMCFEPCKPCQEPCKWSCKHMKCTKHCGELCDREPCNEPCAKRLNCGHQCIGLCGEPCPGLCRECDKEEVTEIFFGEEDEEGARFVLLPDCGHVFEYKGLDQWMKTENDGKESQEVTYKECPKCKTAIKKCLRYSNTIKQYLKDVDTIKAKEMAQLGSKDLRGELITIESSLDDSNRQFIIEELEKLAKIIARDAKPGRKQLLMFPHVVKAKLMLLSQIAGVIKILHGCTKELERSRTIGAGFIPGTAENILSTTRRVKRYLNKVKVFIGKYDYLFPQQISDGETEICRLTLMAKIAEFQQQALSRKAKLELKEENILKVHLHWLQESGWKKEKISKKKEETISKVIDALGKKYGLDGLTEMERKEIVKAMGLSKGHWFRCPNGHFYCIGECGGAMETAKCPECGEAIGGTQHTLLSTNQLAPEMDGAEFAAWSETANNPANWDLEALR